MDKDIFDVLITVIIAILSSTGLWGYLEARRKKLIETAEKDTTMCQDTKKLLIALAKVQICQMSVAFIERGYILNEEADLLEELFIPYHELGGNGSGEVLYKQAINLPRRANKYMKGESNDDVN